MLRAPQEEQGVRHRVHLLLWAAMGPPPHYHDYSHLTEGKTEAERRESPQSVNYLKAPRPHGGTRPAPARQLPTDVGPFCRGREGACREVVLARLSAPAVCSEILRLDLQNCTLKRYNCYSFQHDTAGCYNQSQDQIRPWGSCATEESHDRESEPAHPQVKVKVLVAQWCPTLCNPMMGCSPPAPLSVGFPR